jgi:DNA replication protein DnaC
MKTKELICTNCNSNFDAEVLELGGREMTFQTLCDPCLEIKTAQVEQERSEKARKARQNEFWVMIPPIYQETDKSRLHANLRAEIDSYTYGRTGLGFAGESGAGKTRAMILLLQRIHEQGKSVMYMKATRLTEVAYQRFDDDYKIKDAAKAAINRCKSADCLLIDDIGKGRLPQSAEELLFDIIDTRMEMQVPLFWTSNAKAKDLHGNFSPDRADPIIRRIGEFTKIITI